MIQCCKNKNSPPATIQNGNAAGLKRKADGTTALQGNARCNFCFTSMNATKAVQHSRRDNRRLPRQRGNLCPMNRASICCKLALWRLRTCKWLLSASSQPFPACRFILLVVRKLRFPGRNIQALSQIYTRVTFNHKGRSIHPHIHVINLCSA